MCFNSQTHNASWRRTQLNTDLRFLSFSSMTSIASRVSIAEELATERIKRVSGIFLGALTLALGSFTLTTPVNIFFQIITEALRQQLTGIVRLV